MRPLISLFSIDLKIVFFAIILTQNTFALTDQETWTNSYYEDGKIKDSIGMRQGLKNGLIKKYLNDGSLDYKTAYDKNNKKWYFLAFYKEGALKARIACNSIKDETGTIVYWHGKGVFYYPNGSIQEKLIFENGFAQGTGLSFHESTMKLKRSATYKKGILDGQIIYYNQSGQKTHKEHWANNKKIK